MAKQLWKPGNMIYPLPAVMVSVTDGEGNDNIITVAWTGTVCTNPAMAYISVRPSRYSYDMIRKTGEFVINLTTEKLARATDFCGAFDEAAAEAKFEAWMKEKEAKIQAKIQKLAQAGDAAAKAALEAEAKVRAAKEEIIAKKKAELAAAEAAKKAEEEAAAAPAEEAAAEAPAAE